MLSRLNGIKSDGMRFGLNLTGREHVRVRWTRAHKCGGLWAKYNAVMPRTQVNYHPDKHPRMLAIVDRYVKGDMKALDRFPDGSE